MEDKEGGYMPASKGMGCRIESVVSVDERGQMVLPKETREKAGIGPGDKLAIISCQRGGQICCLALIKAEELTSMIKGLLGPMMKDILE